MLGGELELGIQGNLPLNTHSEWNIEHSWNVWLFEQDFLNNVYSYVNVIE